MEATDDSRARRLPDGAPLVGKGEGIRRVSAATDAAAAVGAGTRALTTDTFFDCWSQTSIARLRRGARGLLDVPPKASEVRDVLGAGRRVGLAKKTDQVAVIVELDRAKAERCGDVGEKNA